MWPRVDGLRTLELGTPGEMRSWLNGLVLDGHGTRVATVEVTDVERTRFGDVTWDFAAAEGEGDRDLEEWRARR